MVPSRFLDYCGLSPQYLQRTLADAKIGDEAARRAIPYPHSETSRVAAEIELAARLGLIDPSVDRIAFSTNSATIAVHRDFAAERDISGPDGDQRRRPIFLEYRWKFIPISESQLTVRWSPSRASDRRPVHSETHVLARDFPLAILVLASKRAEAIAVTLVNDLRETLTPIRAAEIVRESNSPAASLLFELQAIGRDGPTRDWRAIGSDVIRAPYGASDDDEPDDLRMIVAHDGRLRVVADGRVGEPRCWTATVPDAVGRVAFRRASIRADRAVREAANIIAARDKGLRRTEIETTAGPGPETENEDNHE